MLRSERSFLPSEGLKLRVIERRYVRCVLRSQRAPTQERADDEASERPKPAADAAERCHASGKGTREPTKTSSTRPAWRAAACGQEGGGGARPATPPPPKQLTGCCRGGEGTHAAGRGFL